LNVYKLINFYTQRFSFPHRGWKYFKRCLQWLRIDNRDYRKRLPNGTFMMVNPSEHMQQQLFWYGYYEPAVVSVLEKNVQPDWVILDIGAHIGYFTLLAAKLAPQGKVFAFEPVNGLFQKLEHHLKDNNLQNVTAINAAVSAIESTTTIYVSDDENTGMSSLQQPENFSGKTESIKTISIDSWFQQDRLNLVKIDVEGNELNVLKGMRQTIEKYKPALIIEVNPATLAYFKLTPADIFNYMQGLGYSNHQIDKENYLFLLKDSH
jgi:FkbM family methyltransferase